MEIVYFGSRELDSDMYARIQDGEVEPHCERCQAELEVHRLKGEATGAIVAIRCPTDPKHFMKTYRVAMPEFDAFLRGRSAEPDED